MASVGAALKELRFQGLDIERYLKEVFGERVNRLTEEDKRL